ncbi:helicase associated domain-containing protein [Arthrobacter sp. H14-L1]|uniref:helicase associated domain-containing protein n=1 Tax=Arthrobacter sp. H14-L1 TaxID=2996697 RepID=UPI00226FAC9A|nr:helicase associated domain-containing protein [Arthrobacter sp. H14-L1]MCY0905796.1 helicase associated domain-containing protein [Arthrobacter sp. H14-L1]
MDESESGGEGETVRMFRTGIPAPTIVELTGVPRSTVFRRIQVATDRDPTLHSDHTANRKPTPGPETKTVPASWAARTQEIHEYRARTGCWPHQHSGDAETRAMAGWLAVRLAAWRRLELPSGHEAWLDQQIPGWKQPSRAVRDAQRWLERLDQLVTFTNQTGSWPRYPAAADDHERVLGVWRHVQRQKLSQGTLAPDQLAALDSRAHGWAGLTRQGRRDS